MIKSIKEIPAHYKKRVIDREGEHPDKLFIPFEVFPMEINWYLSGLITPLLNKLGITPNVVTLSRPILSIICAVLLIYGEPWSFMLGAVFIELVWLTDYIDGDLAREFGMVSEFGGYLEDTVDPLSKTIILLGVSLGVYRYTGEIALFVLGILLLSGVLQLMVFTRTFRLIGGGGFKEDRMKTDTNNLIIKTTYKLGPLKYLFFTGAKLYVLLMFIMLFGALSVNVLYIGLIFLTFYVWVFYIVGLIAISYSMYSKST